MCKSPKPAPIKMPETSVLTSPFDSSSRGDAGVYFSNRLGRSALRIRPGTPPNGALTGPATIRSVAPSGYPSLPSPRTSAPPQEPRSGNLLR